MKLQLIARHLRDDVDRVVEEVDDVSQVQTLLQTMEREIAEDRDQGSNWRMSIRPTEDTYR
ncbi:hypothetical protein RZ532_06155 [Nitratireductor aquimarinus]|uniref:hypothetical protein n=1 Tax=Nitratireductor aquimarinus TaxID=889300 RepID=UPI0029365C11|nr:hypothetical protein [Nitratireductor aquimarinus]MDV2965547.1 hypothetical protein [Nitratireductor aquimarinus]